MKGRILIVEDDPSFCELLHTGLEHLGFECESTTSPDEAVHRAHAADVDAVVTDLKMRGLTGLEVCERIVADRPDLPVVVMTAFGSLDTAIGAIRAGAYDFLTKPFEIAQLGLVLERAVRHRKLQVEVRCLRRIADESEGFDELIGDSPAMKRVYELLSRVMESDASVLLSGESGTGKEVVARILHRHSRAAAGPFVAVNCAAVPEALLESELFGHERGAFTDARESADGLFQEANGGTLFLDEIGDLPLALQPKLLRVLQERTVRRVGGTQERPFDARLVVATHRDLESAVEEGAFREDLFFRVNVVRIELPPLRNRGTDVLLLAQHFVDRFARRARKTIGGFSPAVAERLLAYRWPGNVRELSNAMERAVALALFDQITVEDLPEKIRGYEDHTLVVGGGDLAELAPLEEVERTYIDHVVSAAAGNKTLAARILGIDRKTLSRKLHRFSRAA